MNVPLFADVEEMLKARNKRTLYDEVISLSEMADFIYLRQHRPLGLGHAVLCGEPVCRNEYFGVILPDDVMIARPSVLAQLIAVHEERGGSVIALEEVPPEETSRYGVVRAEEAAPGLFAIRDMVEKPAPGTAPSNLAIMGRYVLSPSIFPILTGQQAGAGGRKLNRRHTDPPFQVTGLGEVFHGRPLTAAPPRVAIGQHPLARTNRNSGEWC